MKYFLALLLTLLPGMATAQTAVQFGAVRTASPWNICVYDSANVCQNFLTLPSTGGGALVPSVNGGLGGNFSSATGVLQFLSGTASASTALASGTTATTATTSPCDNSTLVATTAFVASCGGGGGGGGNPGGSTNAIQYKAGASTFGGTNIVANSIVLGGSSPSESTALPNGITATTQTTGDSTTKIATDAFVATAVAGGTGAVTSVFGRTGAVTATSGDYTASQVTGALVNSNNLSDVSSASSARTNLGLGTFATQNYATPPAIGGGTPSSGSFTTLTSTGTTNFIGGPVQVGGNTMTFPTAPATLAFQVGTFTPGDCIQVASSGSGGMFGGLADAGATCGSGGGGGGSVAHSQTFVAGTNFTPGTTTTLTLSFVPASQAAVYVYEDGVAQPQPSAWSINLTTGVITFVNPISAQNTVYVTWLSTSLTAGTVNTVSVVTTNGFAGSVANPTTTPAITISTTASGYLQGNGTAISQATGTANTMLGNWTNTTGNVVANSMPTCTDSGAQHLNYVAGSGITCGSGTGNAITALTGDVTATGPGSVAGTISGNAVTYAKMQQVATQRLLGNPSGSTTNVTEIQLGTTLTFSAGALQTNSHTGDATSAANSFAMTVVGLQTIPVKSGTPSDGQTLTYVAANSDWEPIAAPAGNVPTGGTAGQVLAKIDATNFNTQWITVSGTGTVTSVTCGTGLSGGTFTTSGTCALSTPVTAGNGGTGNTSNTVHGVMLGEGSSNLGVTAAGTSGQPLLSGGASADPSYGGQELIRTARRTITSGSSDTATAADFLILWYKTVGSASTENIPACASGIDGKMYAIVDEKGDAGANNITVTPATGTILGTTSLIMNVNLSSVTLQCDGTQTNWVVE